MTTSIGNTTITSIQEVVLSASQEVDEMFIIGSTTNNARSGENLGQEIELSVTLVQSLHPNSLSVEEQRQEIKELTGISARNNSFQYQNLNGYISVESVDISETSDAPTLRRATIQGKYLPWPKHFPLAKDCALVINSGNTYTISTGEVETYCSVDLGGQLDLQGEIDLTG